MKRCMGCMELYEDQYDVCPHCGYEEGYNDHQLLHIEAGQMLADRYIIGRSLGFGGFGVTYLGWDTKLERKVAIKEYLPSEFATRMIHHQEIMVDSNEKRNSQFLAGMKRFLSEGEKLAQVGDVEGIVHMYDCFEANNTAYITMEYLKGMTLTEYLNNKGIMSEQEVMDMMLPIFKALETVHEKGIIHRDIAPDNLFVTFDENGKEKLKLIDFGSSKFASTSHSKSLTVMIKPGYSPEEQYRSNGDQGTYTDVYALAAVMYKMVTGEVLPDSFERRTAIESHKKDPLVEPDKYNKSLSTNFIVALLNALNVRIADRTRTISDFENELVSFDPVKRKGNSIRKIDFMRWPVWAKIGLPVAAIAAVGLVVFAVTKVFSGAATRFTVPEGYTRVPDFVMADFNTEAQEWASERKLNITAGETMFSPNVDGGLVLSQDQHAGSVVKENTVIVLTLSTGEETYVMPDVRGMRLEEARRALECMGVIVDSKVGSRDGLVLDGVVDQDMSAYTDIKAGSTVVLTVNSAKSVSLGTYKAGFIEKEDESQSDSKDEQERIGETDTTKEISGTAKEAPNLVGTTFEEALDIAYEFGWEVFVRERVAGEGAVEGTVLSQRVYDVPDERNILEITVALPDTEFSLPDLTLKDKNTVIQILKNLGIGAELDEEYNEIIAEGLVISQGTSSGKKVKAGDRIAFTVSNGAKPFDMPLLTDVDEATAIKLATDNNLVVNATYTTEGDLEEGTVVEQSIKEGEKVRRGTVVTVTVFSRKDIVEVPSVDGMTLEAAKKALTQAGFKYTVNEQESSVTKNQIIDQQPVAGLPQKKGATVVLTVSIGGWSAWSTDIPPKGSVYETKTQYRARSKETITSDNATSPGTGWQLVKTEFTGWTDYIPQERNSEKPIQESEEVRVTVRTQERHRELMEQTTESPLDSSWELVSSTDNSHWSDWSDWSGWSRTNETSLPSSNTTTEVDVEHRVFYGWYYFTCPKCGTHSPNWNINCSSCNTFIPYMNGVSQVWTYDNACPDGYYSWANGDDGANDHCRYRTRSWIEQHTYKYRKWSDWSSWNDINSTPQNTSNQIYESREVYDSDIRSKIYTYTYERWGDWSEYDDKPVSGDQSEKRMVYRYKN